MVDRNLHPKYIPQCPTQVPMVNQYMWSEKDSNLYQCNNGIAFPIYDTIGNVSYTLPLSEYPPANSIHPHVLFSRYHNHLQRRYPLN